MPNRDRIKALFQRLLFSVRKIYRRKPKMDLSSSSVVETLSSKLTRNILLIVALIIAIIAYYYTVEFYDPNKNFLSQR
jgi:ABC-type multidrug transport system permease subunit